MSFNIYEGWMLFVASRCSETFVFLDSIRLKLGVVVSPLTVGASVDFDAQTDAALFAPLQRDEPQEADHDAVLQLVAHRALGIGVPGESLWTSTHGMG